jgi:cell division protein FtsQ
VALALEAVLALALVGAFCYGVFAYASRTEQFRMRSFEIEGPVTVDDLAIVAASQVSQQDNMLLLDCAAVASRIESLARIKRCSVQRIFPDRLHIRVEERTAVATVLVRNRLYEIDEACVVLGEMKSDGKHTGPYVDVKDLAFAQEGEVIDSELLREALRVLRAFRGSAMMADVAVSEISIKSGSDIRMYCDELPFELRWGRGDYERQVARLDVLWQQQGKELPCLEYLELRFGQHLACK